MTSITPQDLKPRLTGGGEIAFVDVREAGEFGEGHPFFAIHIPYSRLEFRVERLIPRKDVPVVLLDAGDGVAARAARRLAALGYADVTVMEGGAPGWAAAGYTLYKGVNLPSKTFGELVEHVAATPRVTADELNAMQAEGRPLVLLDGRTPHEYARMTIPGSRSCPNAELGHRLPALVGDTTTPVIVNCAGRTRSIIGAQSLINLGVENPVFALENGTQGWTLAGFELDRGHEPQPVAALGADAVEQSRRNAATLIEKFAVPVVDRDTLARWQEDEARTLYLLDVRTAEEFAAGHLPRAVHAPGGQLVQATDQWVAVRGARVVLADDTSLRAAQSAYWLRQMGHEAYVLNEDVSSLGDLQTGPDKGASAPAFLPDIDPSSLAGKLERGAILLDLRPSVEFRSGHIEGARWAIRPRVQALELPDDADIVLTADKRSVAEVAALDLKEQGCGSLSFLSGDAAGWRAAGLAIAETPDDPPDEARIDYLFFVHDRHHDNKQAMRGYLEWEIALIGQLDEQERGVFAPET
ncbi:MAG: rhodanese-like domain-containing protein [Hyphomicrobiales bacterium]|nr:rhodanese-like domain-containing protein [Hyphomicrobiales bacterium]